MKRFAKVRWYVMAPSSHCVSRESDIPKQLRQWLSLVFFSPLSLIYTYMYISEYLFGFIGYASVEASSHVVASVLLTRAMNSGMESLVGSWEPLR